MSTVVDPDTSEAARPPIDDLVGATVTPTDATVNPGEAALSFAKGARDRGAVFAFGVTVTGFRMQGGAVTGVETDTGVIDAETVVTAWRTMLAPKPPGNVTS